MVGSFTSLCHRPVSKLTRAYFEGVLAKEPCLNLESTGFLGYTGMQHRMSLPEDDGALFSFNTAADHGFWMQNVKISLDIIFLDSHDRIVHIHENAKPMSTTPIYSGHTVSCVLEANGGWCKRNKVEVGNKVRFTGF